jgi:hypothetical protein
MRRRRKNPVDIPWGWVIGGAVLVGGVALVISSSSSAKKATPPPAVPTTDPFAAAVGEAVTSGGALAQQFTNAV